MIWALCLKRVLNIDIETCQRCGGCPQNSYAVECCMTRTAGASRTAISNRFLTPYDELCTVLENAPYTPS